MPGKQEPEYFPLNLNTMNGGIEAFYGGGINPILIPHRHQGKFETTVVHHGSPIAMALHNSPVNATTLMSENLMSEYINVNGLPPVNSEDEEDDDDIVSQSGSESVSVQGSDIDLDVEVMDDMDSLVLNIRDKLRMAAPQFNLHHHLHTASDYWRDSSSATSTPNSIHSTNTENELLILSPATGAAANSTGSGMGSISGNTGGGNCNASCSSNNSSGMNNANSNSTKSQRKQRRGPLNRSSNLQQWRHSHPNATNTYYKQFHSKHGGSISKSSKKNYQPSHWWSSRSYGDLSKQSRPKDAYQLLQELIHSGTLIQEAVRRLNRKCMNTSSNSNGSTMSSNSSSNQEPITPSNSTASLVVSSSKFSYLDEDSESSFSSHHHPSLHLSAPCN
jgi:hypothetical protein